MFKWFSTILSLGALCDQKRPISGVVFVPAQRLSGVVLTLPVVSLQSRFVTGRFAAKSFRYRSFRYKVVSPHRVRMELKLTLLTSYN